MRLGRPASNSRFALFDVRADRFASHLLVLALLVPGSSAAHSSTPPSPHVHAGQRWEAVLTGSATYSNPYRHLLLMITWTCVSNCWTIEETFQSRYGFWDGGANDRTFKIRAFFSQPLNGAATATWRWATTCTTTAQGLAAGEPDCSMDAGLNSDGAGNTVTVARSDPARGITNPLYRGSGVFCTSENNTGAPNGGIIRGNVHLAMPCSVPFYWLGDTAWAAPVRAKFDATATPDCGQASGWSNNDWKCYVQDRVARGFSIIQVSVPQWWMKNPLRDTNNQTPFVASGTFPAWSKWNPAFWRGFEEKIQYANERGLVVVIVGVMEPSYQFLTNQNPPFVQRYPPTEDAKTFARNLAARLAGNIVIPSPAFDTKPDGGAASALIRAVGAELDGALPRHRIVNHFGGSTPVTAAGAWNDYRDFQGEAWLDFQLFQSGQCKNLPTGGGASPPVQLQNFTHRARHMPQDLRTFLPIKGSVNGEALYDFEGAVLEPGETQEANAQFYRPYRIRHTAYLSTLSGSFGYTVGVYGIWDWGLGDGNGPYEPRSPRDTVGRTSILQMQHLANLFRGHRWDALAPMPTLIRNNPVEPDPANPQFHHLQMVVSRDLGHRTTLAYLPDNAAIHLQLNSVLYPGFSSPRWTKRFFNPRTGQLDARIVTPTLVSGTADVYRFGRPDCLPGESCIGQNGDRDWVLVLTDTAAGAPLWAGISEASSLQTWSAVDPESQEWSIHGQIVGSSGQPASGELTLSAGIGSLQRLPQAVQGTDGTFLVVWEVYDLDGDGPGIFGRLVSGTGAMLGEPFQVNAAVEGRQTEPMLTADATGRFVVVWTDSGADSEGSIVVVRRFSDHGEPLEDEVIVASPGAGVAHSPRVSAEPTGAFVVSWVSDEPEQGKSAIAVQRFDAEARRLGAQLVIDSGPAGSLALERLEVDALGNFQMVWQRLLDGQSLGHFSTSFDRATESLGQTAQVADAWQ